VTAATTRLTTRPMINAVSSALTTASCSTRFGCPPVPWPLPEPRMRSSNNRGTSSRAHTSTDPVPKRTTIPYEMNSLVRSVVRLMSASP